MLVSLAAYALRFATPGRRTILLVALAGNPLPSQILLIPVSRIAPSTGIDDTLLALVIVQVGFGMGCYAFVLHGSCAGLPAEVFDAAVLDGAGPGRTYWRIVLPRCRPIAARPRDDVDLQRPCCAPRTGSRSRQHCSTCRGLLELVERRRGRLAGRGATATMSFVFQKQFVAGLLVGSNKGATAQPVHRRTSPDLVGKWNDQ